MMSSIMHSCDESDDSLRINSVEVEVEVEDTYQFCSFVISYFIYIYCIPEKKVVHVYVRKEVFVFACFITLNLLMSS